jgi:hypothetical protein
MAGLFGPAFAGSKPATDTDQLMKELNKLEANLKAMADKKAEARQEQQNQLAEKKAELNEKLKHIAKLSQNENIDEEQLVDLLTEITVLREEIKLLQAPANAQPDEQLVSSGEEDLVLAFDGPVHPGGGMATPMDVRSGLDDKGVTFEVVYTGEVSSNVSGGISQRSEYLENGDIMLSIDAEKLMGWKGASFSFYALANAGGSPSEIVGDMQTVSNIDADDTWKLYEAWYQQNLFDEKLSLLLGLFDLNSEFDVTENAGLFLNSSFGIGPDYSQSGGNGPSIFPTTSLAFRVRVQPTDAFYVQSAVFDGVPVAPTTPPVPTSSLEAGTAPCWLSKLV